MLFENCTYHLGQKKQIVVECQNGAELQCRECFGSDGSENGRIGVVLCDGTIQYFFQWNRYIIDELLSLLKVISEQGTDFLIKPFTPTQNKQKSQNVNTKAINAADQKHILSYVISKHINLLSQNLAFMSQPKNFSELINQQFLCDLFNIATKTVQHILDPIKKEFQTILKKQFSLECNMEWESSVIDVIENVRQQILNDWTKDCVIQKAVSTELFSKSESEENDKLKTQHSIDRSKSSSVSLSFDEQMDIISLSQCGEFEIRSDENEIIDRTESYIIDTKKQNEMLMRLLQSKQQQIENLNQKLIQSDQRCQEWINKYYKLQQNHKKIVEERIPVIQNQFIDLESTMTLLMQENDGYMIKIEQLQKKLLEIAQQNNLLKVQKPKYYVNPNFEKQKINQTLMIQVIELQSQNMYKKYDILLLTNCLKQSKSFIQNINFQNKNDLTIVWQQQITKKLQSLQTLTLKQL